MIVAGIGCRRGCHVDDIVAIVQQAAREGGCCIDALAAPYFKRHEAGLAQAAAALGLTLHFVEEAALVRAQPGCVTQSAAALRATGFGSIAEAAAIAASGGALVLRRIQSGTATCAVAASGEGVVG